MKNETKLEGVALSRAGFMQIFNCNWAKVEKYLGAGLPVVTRGGFNSDGSPRKWVFDSVPCARFLDAYWERQGREKADAQRAGQFLKQLHPNDPRYHVAEATAERIERAKEREAEQTIRKEDAVQIADEIFGLIREHFGKLPDAVVGQFSEQLGLPAEKATKVKCIIQREIDSALSGMDSGEIAAIESTSESELQ